MNAVSSRDFWNQVRYNPESRSSSRKGHYESYFFRANHPSKPLAFWIRYTIFVPKDKQRSSLGELWGIFFDGESNTVSAGKMEYPLGRCQFSKNGLSITMPDAQAESGQLHGEIMAPNHLKWSLSYQSAQQPLLLLPQKLYTAPLPKAKAVVGAPLAKFNGHFSVNGKDYALNDWLGSENHNWGEKHTDQYAWGQVSGFDNNENVFLEAISGKVKIGPVLSPLFTIMVLRVSGKDYCFNNLAQAFKAKAHYDFFEWHFKSKTADAEIEGVIRAPRNHFVALTYYNPPGGNHTCLNSKIASCEVKFTQGSEVLLLKTQSRAAFEILTDRVDHQLKVAV